MVTPRKKSARHERGRIDRLLRHSIAQARLSRLHTKHFASFRDERLRDVGPQAVRHDLNLLGNVIAVAVRD